MMATPQPTLAELLADPKLVGDVEPAAIPSLIGQLSSLTLALAARQMEETSHGRSTETAQPDKLLDAKAIAERLGVSVDYVYEHARGWPFVVRQGRALRFSEHGFERWLRRRQGRV